MTDQTDRPALRDRIAKIRSRHAALACRDWEAKPHQHPADGCRCLSCYDDPTGWLVDHPSALDCEERVAAEINDFGRNRASCDAGPLLTYEEADALAHAAEDIAFLLEEADAVLSALPASVDRADDEAPATECSAQHRQFDDGRLCIRAAQHHGDHIDERGYHWSDTVAVYPLADGTFRTGVNRRPTTASAVVVRRATDETPGEAAPATDRAAVLDEAAGIPTRRFTA